MVRASWQKYNILGWGFKDPGYSLASCFLIFLMHNFWPKHPCVMNCSAMLSLTHCTETIRNWAKRKHSCLYLYLFIYIVLKQRKIMMNTMFICWYINPIYLMFYSHPFYFVLQRDFEIENTDFNIFKLNNRCIFYYNLMLRKRLHFLLLG